MLKCRRWLLVVTVIGLLVPLYAAQGKEIVRVTITGPGFDEAVEVTLASELAVFREMRFDEGMIALPPTDPAAPFFEVRLGVGVENQIIATDVNYFYLTPDAGYMYYADVIGGGSDAEGKWFRLSAATDLALRDFLADRGADIPHRRDAGGRFPFWNWLTALAG